MTTHISRRRRIIGWICLFHIMPGCSSHDAWKARTYQTTGSISINGESPTGAVILLLFTDNPPDRRKSQPFGVVKEDGSYQLSTYGVDDGAPLGNYAVTFFWQTNPGSSIADDRLNGKFRTVSTSPQKVTISKGKNVIPHIDLNGVKVSNKQGDANISLPISQESNRLKTKGN